MMVMNIWLFVGIVDINYGLLRERRTQDTVLALISKFLICFLYPSTWAARVSAVTSARKVLQMRELFLRLWLIGYVAHFRSLDSHIGSQFSCVLLSKTSLRG